MKVLTFGEIMLRLKAPGHERFFQSPSLEATFGGGEANVAVSLANYGLDAAFVCNGAIKVRNLCRNGAINSTAHHHRSITGVDPCRGRSHHYLASPYCFHA